MKPYYEEDGIVIYHGDCRKILPGLPAADLVLTDPPYGIGLTRTYGPKHNQKPNIVGDDERFDPAHLIAYEQTTIIWGGNNFANSLPVGGWLCWDKRCNEAADRMHGSPFELAWSSDQSKFKMYRIMHGGIVNADSWGCGRYHPTQKPISLMAAIIKDFKCNSVRDPYMGSGTTLIAAKRLRLPAIGIEIDERYCEIAAKRLSQGVLELTA